MPNFGVLLERIKFMFCTILSHTCAEDADLVVETYQLFGRHPKYQCKTSILLGRAVIVKAIRCITSIMYNPVVTLNR